MIRLAIVLCAWSSTVLADPVVIEDATAIQQSGKWRFDVTLRHPDTGWDHYADAWEVLGADGASLGVRTLAHPHVAEQPFTRSLSGVQIPEGTETVTIRARCLVDGWSDATLTVTLP